MVVDSFTINIEAVCDVCLFFFWLAGTLAQIAARASRERGSFSYRFLLFFDTKIIWI